MAAKKQGTISPEKLELYEKLVATNPEVKRKGDTNPYTSHNGHMFTHLTPEGVMAIRLPQEEVEPFLRKHKTRLFETYGVIKKDWVVVPDGLLSDTKELQKYFEISFRHVEAMRPKPTKRAPKK